jgi:hypothetical protein
MTTYLITFPDHTPQAFVAAPCPKWLGADATERGNAIALVGRCAR